MSKNFKTRIIMNPASASGQTTERWPILKEYLDSHKLSYDVSSTTGPGTATVLTRKAIHDGYEMVVAVGGDGTVNEVVNGFFQDDRLINPGAVLGVLCVGTGGDFVKTLGISKEPEEAARRLLGREIMTIDVGRVKFRGPTGEETLRYFVNIADIGVGGETVERTSRKAKKGTGAKVYFWHTLVSLIKYKNKLMRIQIDDRFDEERVVSLLVVANGQYFGGGMHIAPEAKLDDGLFDVIIVGDITTLTFLANTPRIYKGTHLSHKKIQWLRGKSVRVSSAERALLDVDGEQPGMVPAEFEILPSILKVKI